MEVEYEVGRPSALNHCGEPLAGWYDLNPAKMKFSALNPEAEVAFECPPRDDQPVRARLACPTRLRARNVQFVISTKLQLVGADAIIVVQMIWCMPPFLGTNGGHETRLSPPDECVTKRQFDWFKRTGHTASPNRPDCHELAETREPAQRALPHAPIQGEAL